MAEWAFEWKEATLQLVHLSLRCRSRQNSSSTGAFQWNFVHTLSASSASFRYFDLILSMVADSGCRAWTPASNGCRISWEISVEKLRQLDLSRANLMVHWKSAIVIRLFRHFARLLLRWFLIASNLSVTKLGENLGRCSSSIHVCTFRCRSGIRDTSVPCSNMNSTIDVIRWITRHFSPE